MLANLLLLRGGLAIIVKGGELFVAAALRLAGFLRLPRVVIGSTLVSRVRFFLGAAVVVLGSRLVVDGAVGVAARLGVPSIVVGLTVVALGTSLPELVTAITSARNSVSDLAVGNVLGANIANLTLIVGSAALILPVELDRPTQVFSFPVMLGLIGTVLGMLWLAHGLTRRNGLTLLAIYAGYLATLALLSLRR